MKKKRRKLSAELKAKVATEALKGIDSVSQIASKYEVHPNQVSAWKRELLNGATSLFSSGQNSDEKAKDKEIEALERKVGELTMEVDFLEKKSVILGLIPGRRKR